MSLIQVFVSHPLAALAVAAVFGLVIGSFLNVVIVRLPQMMQREWEAECAELGNEPVPVGEPFNLSRPRSHCPSCGHPIAWYRNIPVVSWLALRGKCAHCGSAISWRYPVVELLTAVLFAACIALLGVTPGAVLAMGFCSACVALAFIDADTSLLPDSITLPLLWAGLLVNMWDRYTLLNDAVIGAMVGYLALWLVYWLFRLVTGKEGMGYGDFKLLAAIGAWLGWQMLPTVILMSSLVAVAVGLVMLATGRAQRGEAMPFGPYLAGAGVLTLLGADHWQILFRSL